MGEEPTYKRAIAYRTNIQSILSASFTKGEGWDPTLAQLPQGAAGRVQIIGTIITKDEQSIMIDDGTGIIHVRGFDTPELFQNITQGSLTLVIGKPRIYQEQKYLAGEICKKLQHEKWFDVQKINITKIVPVNIKEIKKEKIPEQIIKEERIIRDTPSPTKQVYDIIKKHDTGNGASYEVVLAEAKFSNTETIIHHLLEEGTIFELQPGKLKVLD